MDNLNITLNDNVEISNPEPPVNVREPHVLINDNIVQIGDDVTIKIGSTQTLPPDSNSYVRNSGTEKDVVLDFGITRGQRGIDGSNGIDGTDGFSPLATVTQIEGGVTISITDVNGTTTATVYNGTDGTDGTDGFSPLATVTPTAYGADISVTDALGTTTAQIVNGYSPIANVTQTSTGATVSITDVNGTTTANITNGIDGTDGTDGTDGFSPLATVTPTATGATISITDKNGTTTANVTNGVDGTDGTDGVTPNISATASVDGTSGTPSVTVTKSGTTENPLFSFAFSGLKGNSILINELFTGNTNTSATLSDDITKYDYVEIYGNESGGRKVFTKLLKPVVGNKFSLFGLFIGSSNTTLYWRGATFEIIDTTTISMTSDYAQVDIKSSGNTISASKQIYLTKVIGYKL